jgi:fumarate reductase flavoprotein subunit
MEPQAVDVAVVGAGFAGLVAAVRAQELGARVALVEATASAPSWSNSRVSGGNLAAAGGSPEEPPDQIAGRLLRWMGEHGDAALIRAWADASVRSYRWLALHGARFVHLRGRPVMAPVRPNRAGVVWEGRGCDVTLRRLHAEFLRRGGAFHGHTAARELVQREGRVVGLVAERREPRASLEIASKAVILADGGFAGNAALLRQHARVARPERLSVRGPGSAVGAGIQMALAAGADFASPEALFGHLVHGDALWNPSLNHYPLLDPVAAGAFLVGPDGRRFVDETVGQIIIANRLARLDDPGGAWVVLDRARWETDARLNQAVPPNPNLLLHGARIVVADDAATLARQMGVPAEALAATLAELHAALSAGRGADLPVPRSGMPPPLRPPFIAVPVALGLTYTVGGPRIDQYGRVVDAVRRPIRGLYAAGRAAGGLDGGPRPVSAGGLGAAIPLGFLAGSHAARAASSDGDLPAGAQP